MIDAFTGGAKKSGNNVTEFYLQDMKIFGCRGCGGCTHGVAENPCVQKDDMAEIYKIFSKCDVVVFASPIYFWSITGTLKTAADRLYAELRCLVMKNFRAKEF